MSKFSVQSRSLWAKKSRQGDLLWLPLPVHLEDTAEVACLLWKNWVSEGVKKRIAEGIGGMVEDAEKLFIFLAAAHDIGKATPVFASQKCGYYELDERIYEQIMVAGLPIERYEFFTSRGKTPHALASQMLLHHAGCPESVAVVLGAHHGKPPDLRQVLENGMDVYPENFHVNRDGKKAWQNVWQELIDYALARAGYIAITELPVIDVQAQVLLSGLLIVADWIASDESLFPYIRFDDRIMPDSQQRSAKGWSRLGLSQPWETENLWMSDDLYSVRFGISAPRRLQEAVKESLQHIHSPGIIVIEGPMGEGKTEAALVAAEVMADITRRRGVFFALPTQATSDGIFPRLVKWVKRLDTEDLQSVRLVHGKAQLNEDFRNLAYGSNISIDDDPGVYVHEWFAGRKRAMLDDFVVGTIDQLLMAALKQKHVMLRHLGLANKVVIIDECHAFDAYMNCYLERALNWLGTYGVPVIVLSATLPADRRKMVIKAYCNKKFQSGEQRRSIDPLNRMKDVPVQENLDWAVSRAYPLITFTDGGKIKQVVVPSSDNQKQVKIQYLKDEMITAKLEELLSNGGCAGIIVNSVDRAQKFARLLKERFGNNVVHLLHSRFLAPDRVKKEKTLLEELGKSDFERKRPRLRIVVGTQVLEQSLDIDFDILFTDICPIDLLLQRIGRLHRHDRDRPHLLQQAICFILGINEVADEFDSASMAIYGKCLLMRTLARLPELLYLPGDISELVQDVYDFRIPLMSDREAYRKAEAEHIRLIEQKRREADAFRLDDPQYTPNMIDWLNTDVPDQKGEASVRDTEDSIEVILIRRDEEGRLRFLPWIEQGSELDPFREPPAELARKLARCTVRLPVAVGGKCKQLDETIRNLEQMNMKLLSAWQQSPWLRGELFLVLDEDLSANLGKYRITYHPDYGLEYAVMEEGNKSDTKRD